MNTIIPTMRCRSSFGTFTLLILLLTSGCRSTAARAGDTTDKPRPKRKPIRFDRVMHEVGEQTFYYAFMGFPKKLKTHPELKKYPVIFTFDRTKYGLTPLPERGQINIVEQDGGIYIQVFAKTIHNITLKEGKDGHYTVHSEEEIFEGTATHKSLIGSQLESIHVKYTADGKGGHKMTAEYWGPNLDLKFKFDKITYEDVKPYLIKWGHYKADKAEDKSDNE